MRGISIAALLLLTALVGVPNAGADPIRTVVYHFAVDSRGFGGSPSLSGHGTVLEGGAAGTASRTGQITVAVQQATADGGLVVDVTEMIDRQDKPLQTIRCAAYGVTSEAVCDLNVGATPEEHILLSYLGRGFLDPSRFDANGHWHTQPHVRSGTLEVNDDFTVTKVDGDAVTISLDHEERNGGYRSSMTGTMIYDDKMDLPDAVTAAMTTARGTGQSDMNIQLSLLSDSMAKPASPNPH